MSYKSIILYAFISMLGVSFPFFQANAQLPQSTFGHNRLQYKVFDWKFYSSENFEVYFYGEGGKNARLAAQYLEEEYLSLTDMLGYAPYSKIKIFLYNSHTDLLQSNVGINENNYTIEGQTNFVKSQVEVAYPGTHEGFKQALRYKISNLIVNDMMYGGSLADMFQNSYLLNLPDWFIEGAALYVSEGWSIEMDDYVRTLFQDKKVKKLTKFSGKDAALIGQSIWNFIAVKYGRSNVSNILNLTRIIRNEESSIANTLGLPFRVFLQEWQQFYIEMGEQVANAYVPPSDTLKVIKKNRKDYLFNAVKISPNGNLLAYARNHNGRYAVFIKNLNTGKEKRVKTLGRKLINQEVDESIPLLSWKDNNTLGIVGAKSGALYMWLYEVSSKSMLRQDLSRFNQINSFSFNEGGSVAVLSADMNGQSDIFLLSLRRNAVKRITNDIFDDNYPKFIPNSTAIVFSSNRNTDTLRVGQVNLSDIKGNHNLFAYDVDTSRLMLKRITNTISRDIYPLPVDTNTIYYLSDQKGIYNLFKYSIKDSIYTQVTNYNSSIEDYDYVAEHNLLSFTMTENGKQYPFVDNAADLVRNVFTPATRRQEIANAKYVSELLQQRRTKAETEAQEEEVIEEEASDIDDEDIILDLGELEFDAEDSLSATSLIDPTDYQMAPEDEASGLIDTDNYVFDTEIEEEVTTQTSFLARLRQSHNTSSIQGPFPYFPRFSADNFSLSWVVDPLMGFGVQAEMGMNDMLEDHKVNGGLVASTGNLRTGKVYAEYQYLKYLLDFHIRYDRSSLFYSWQDEVPQLSYNQRYIKNIVTVGASYPFSVNSRISFSPYFVQTRYVDLNIAAQLNNPNAGNDTNVPENYAGGKVEFVFDNTTLNGLNLFEGTRGVARLSHHQGLDNKEKSFANVEVDIRHYQKIHRELVFAARVFMGHFFGESPKRYMLGGMDNWLFNNIEGRDDEEGPLFSADQRNSSDILFHKFVTNLRGYNYNKFNGATTFLFNAELRFPLIKYLHRGPIASNFFRNFQLVGFYDFGSAWTGNSPFEEVNSVNTEVIKSPGAPFRADIINFKNPWLASYGGGVRTVLLGYYLKFDVAWPIEDFVVGSPKFYLTLGFDF